MTTPICDFVRKYAESGSVRLHMPGHKGVSALGMESLDITEIQGADCLYTADGIIAESERNAGELFGAHTFYSAEGSSLCIRAMLLLTVRYAREQGRRPLILAARNIHRAFMSAVALLDLEVEWLWADGEDGYLCCLPDPDRLDRALSEAAQKPVALYITSPDYLGNVADVEGISKVCHKHGVLLLVDNAHGAYLKFLTPSLHPIDLGADACCDSAHKTLCALTGAAYLHVSKSAPTVFSEGAKNALLTFGSTSPSYLILQSLDALNARLSCGYTEDLAATVRTLDVCRQRLSEAGYTLVGNEPLKLTLSPKEYGYEGTELAEILLNGGMVCEFADRDYVVMMITPEISAEQAERLTDALCAIPKRPPISEPAPQIPKCEAVTSVRDAYLSPSCRLPVNECVGRVLAEPSVSCPPAVPIVICGEKITPDAVRCFEYYGVRECFVIKRR